jgi:hypothetical protein
MDCLQYYDNCLLNVTLWCLFGKWVIDGRSLNMHTLIRLDQNFKIAYVTDGQGKNMLNII